MKRYKINRLPVLAAIIILCLALCGCGARTSSASSTSSSKPVSSSLSSKADSSKAQTSSISNTANMSSSSKPENTSSSSSSGKTEKTSGKTEKASSSVSSTTPKKAAKASAASPKRTSKYVTLTIDATKAGDGVIASGKRVEISAGESVYSVLKSYCSKNNIMLYASKSGNGVYVSAIDGMAETDYGPQSGWLYSVDGVFSQQDCNSYKLKGGENIKWIYTTDNGKSERNGK